MNWAHLKTYIWVRWRLSVNQIRRTGPVGIAISAVLNVLRIFGAIITFVVGLLVGAFALRQASPMIVMAVWDMFVAGFLLFWMIGLLSELQRTELLSLDHFMHLPVSPTGAFLLNYMGSSIGLSLILFLPAMIGLWIGMIFSQGFAVILLLPVILAFFLMVTGITQQFRGWLASMITNPRRRRTIYVIVSMLFILIFQIPNILTNLGPGAKARRQERKESAGEFSALSEKYAAGQITRKEYEDQLAAKRAAFDSARKEESIKTYETLRQVNLFVPPGWLPYDAAAAVQGRMLPVMAGFVGMGLIGAISLRRSYRTTIRMYMGEFTAGRAKERTIRIRPDTKTGEKRVHSAAFLTRSLPFLSDHASATTLMCLRSLMRAPEVKMMLLMPVIMMVVYGGVLVSKEGNPVPELARPLIALGFVGFVLIIGLTAFVGNQFAFDRGGFRVFVLSGAPRRDILLGKNLSLFPFAFILMALIIGLSQWVQPMRLDHLAAVLLQTIPMYLLFCLAGNLLSIFSPVTLKTGSGSPASHQGIRVLYQIAFMFLVPIPIGLTLIPLGAEALFSFLHWATWFPAFLILGLAQTILVIWLYRISLNWQGSLLQNREKIILDVVSAKVE